MCADCVVPIEYLTQHLLRDRLAPVNVSRYHDDTLFYLFYCCPGDQAQYNAAMELYALVFPSVKKPRAVFHSYCYSDWLESILVIICTYVISINRQ